MLPVTRAHLDHICCICLSDIRPSVFTQKVYDVKTEKHMSKVLKLTAHITILKNPINQKYINDYCRKICEICFVKTQYSYAFRQKIMASTTSLKELMESGDLNDIDIERLQYFCRICLNRQETISNDVNSLKAKHLRWLKNCSGIRYTSITDTEKFRIKEGTNINEIAEINDTYFPRQLCQNCFKKLQNVEEFRKSATQSFEYMISVMGDVSGGEYDLATQEIKHFNNKISWKELPPENLVTQESLIFHNDNNKSGDNKQENFISDIFEVQVQQNINSDEDPIENTTDNSNAPILVDDTSVNVMDFMEDLTHYSEEEDDNGGDAHFALNFSNNEVSSVNHSDDDNKNTCQRKSRSKKYDNKINISCANQEENLIASQQRNKLEDENLSKNSPKRTRKSKEPNNNLKSDQKKNADNNVKENIICEECSKIFSCKTALRKHKKNVHRPELLQIWHTCEICSKQFKCKKHLQEHIRAVHEKLKPFKCSYCTKAFSSNGSKKNHELIHTDNFPFACEWCQKRFRRSHQLKVHLEVHTTSPELLCSICKRSQRTAEDLAEHLKSHDEKRMQCPWCGKLFKRGSHLTDHQNAVHLKLRPFKCDFCELAFGDRKSRLVHQKSHTEDRPMTCTVCNRGFKSRNTLNRHINETGHASEDYKSSKSKKSKKKPTDLQSQRYTPTFNSIFEL